MLRRLLLPIALTGAVVFLPQPLAAQAPSEFYDQHCAGCHTIGEGAGAGPDLRDVTRRRDREWLIRFLLDPDDFKTDPAVAQMIKDAGGLEMPATEGLTREMAVALVDLIDQRSASAAAYPAAGASQPITPADVAQGRDLFTGRTRLIAGGPACVQCHDAATLVTPGGGRLGPDLTQVTGRLGGAPGVAAWLRAAPTPVMRAVYRTAALTPEESRQLAAFFDDAAAHAAIPPQSRALPLVTGSLVFSTIVAGLIGVLGAQRFRGVRSPMVARAARRMAASGGSR